MPRQGPRGAAEVPAGALAALCGLGAVASGYGLARRLALGPTRAAALVPQRVREVPGSGLTANDRLRLASDCSADDAPAWATVAGGGPGATLTNPAPPVDSSSTARKAFRVGTPNAGGFGSLMSLLNWKWRFCAAAL